MDRKERYHVPSLTSLPLTWQPSQKSARGWCNKIEFFIQFEVLAYRSAEWKVSTGWKLVFWVFEERRKFDQLFFLQCFFSFWECDCCAHFQLKATLWFIFSSFHPPKRRRLFAWISLFECVHTLSWLHTRTAEEKVCQHFEHENDTQQHQIVYENVNLLGLHKLLLSTLNTTSNTCYTRRFKFEFVIRLPLFDLDYSYPHSICHSGALLELRKAEW